MALVCLRRFGRADRSLFVDYDSATIARMDGRGSGPWSKESGCHA